MWYAVTAIAVIFGFVVGFNLGQSSRNNEIRTLHRNSADDRSAFLEILRREIANIIIWREPDAYVELYQEIRREILALEKKSPSELLADRSVIAALYPSYRYFDAIGVKEYVLYADAVDSMDMVELSSKYRDIVMYQALTHQLDGAWKYFPAIGKNENDHLSNYAQRIKDTKSKVMVNSIMARYFAAQGREVDLYREAYATVRRIWDPVEDKYGVHLTDREEYFVYATFYFDDGRTYESIYRSDSNFNELVGLQSNIAVENDLEDQLGLRKKLYA